MTKIASLAPAIRRGEITGIQTGGPPLTDATRLWKCEACGGYFDMLDLGAVLGHEGELPHPGGDQRQKISLGIIAAVISHRHYKRGHASQKQVPVPAPALAK